MNESQTKGVIIKKPHIQNEDILITDYTWSGMTQCMKEDLKIANIATVLDEAALYYWFNIQATVSHVSDIDGHKCEGNMMAVRTAVVHDRTGFATLTVFSQLTNGDSRSYKFTNVNVGHYKKEHILKIDKKVQIYQCKNTMMENNKIQLIIMELSNIIPCQIRIMEQKWCFCLVLVYLAWLVSFLWFLIETY